MPVLFRHVLTLSFRRHRVLYALIAIVCLLAIAQFPSIKTDTDPENMLRADHPARIYHNEVKRAFSMHDAIVVGMVANESTTVFSSSSLSDIYDVTESILTINGVLRADLMSISTVDNIYQDEEGSIRFEWMLPTRQVSNERAEKIESDIKRLPMLYDTLVANTGKAIAIYVPISDKNQSYQIAEEIRLITQSFSDHGNWLITGLPVAEDQFGVEMFIQMGISAPLAGLTIFILLYLFFRNSAVIMAPMIVAMVTVIVVMGSLVGAGFTVHIMSSMIAIFLMPIAVVDSVHILSEFSDRFKANCDIEQIIHQVMENLFTPMLFTSVTSAVGFYSLMLTPIPPVQIFGFFVGSGILLAFILTVTFIPTYLSKLSDKTLQSMVETFHSAKSKSSRITYFTKKVLPFVNENKGRVIVFFSLLLLMASWGISQIEINDNPIRWFKPSHEVRAADKILNQHFAGTYDAYLVFEQDTTFVDLKHLLDDIAVPNSLRAWLTEAIESSATLVQSERLQSLIFHIDDKLFFTIEGEEIESLQRIKAQLENVLRESQAFLSPQKLSYIEGLQQFLVESGQIGKSNSLVDIIKTVNRELKSGNESDFHIPTSANGVAQVLLQYQSSHRPLDLWHFVTPNYQSSLVWLQLSSGDNQNMSEVVTLVEQYIKQNPLPNNISVNWAGKTYLNLVWQENMVTGMLKSLMSAFFIVLIMMILLFRSVLFGLLAMLPLSLTICFTYGLIGIVGKNYDMPIAVLSALTLGLSVDFAIHFIQRARAIFEQTQNLQITLNSMFEEPATAITRNSLVISIGFVPLLFAPLMPYITVGVFLICIMSISAVVTLFILPSAMLLGRSFLFPNVKREKKHV